MRTKQRVQGHKPSSQSIDIEIFIEKPISVPLKNSVPLAIDIWLLQVQFLDLPSGCLLKQPRKYLYLDKQTRRESMVSSGSSVGFDLNLSFSNALIFSFSLSFSQSNFLSDRMAKEVSKKV